ncbi:LIM and SH3 domain protein 1 isoform X2 [Morone saxatilis]|uniref:LIM and SH3 domain protein 1 isoform X2 n=1 Tax=Morone saxatilis TaxID=34816 RepID=UPI0015E20447|nr:LIM and SH3 domain protein 1 isoform X2 [Morone saxatilis]
MNPLCSRCNLVVYPTEKVNCLDKYWHKGCFSCEVCKMTLNMKNYKGFEKRPYCNASHRVKPGHNISWFHNASRPLLLHNTTPRQTSPVWLTLQRTSASNSRARCRARFATGRILRRIKGKVSAWSQTRRSCRELRKRRNKSAILGTMRSLRRGREEKAHIISRAPPAQVSSRLQPLRTSTMSPLLNQCARRLPPLHRVLGSGTGQCMTTLPLMRTRCPSWTGT